MTTLSELRTRLRQQLHDVTPLRWDDDSLDRHIAHAIEDVSQSMPRELGAALATTTGSREVSLATLGGLIDVERVEYPVRSYPPALIGFQRWGETLLLDAPVAPTGDEARISYTVHHTVDDESSTLTPFQEELVVLAASAFAVIELAAASIDTLTTGGPTVPSELRAWAQARQISFRQLLHQYGRRPAMRVRRVVA
ncbi:hypothetical protein J0H33_11935 [bacterium]|nr:hypothetical protein [bacterium]